MVYERVNIKSQIKFSDYLYSNINFKNNVKIVKHKYCYDNYYKYNLTKRESICLYYVLKGMTAKIIANKMSISTKTVEKFIQILKEKLGCHCKMGLIQKALKDKMDNVIPEGIDNE